MTNLMQSADTIVPGAANPQATAEFHRHQIMWKLKIHNMAELTKFAIREGLSTL